MVCGIIVAYFEIKDVDSMSVIMAYKTEDKIYLGADNRTVTEEDVFSRDNANKIVAVNDCVAVAVSGCRTAQVLFEMRLKRLENRSDFRVEDALQYIKKIYRMCKFWRFAKFSKAILNIGSQFLVVGKNRMNEPCIYMVLISKKKLRKPLLKNWFIFPPHGMDIDVCSNIFITNTKKYPNNFIQKTIKDIAPDNEYISPSGDIWVYDMRTGKSTSEHFS